MSKVIRGLLKSVRYGTALILTLVLFAAYLPVYWPSSVIAYHIQRWSTPNLPVLQHQWVSHEQISDNIRLAVIASEDQRFFEHWGIDIASLNKAWHEQRKQKRGGSTISQQTAKNVLLWSGRSYLRKGLEFILTPLIELTWGKNRVLTVYLNSIEFGTGIIGVEAAAQHYFQRSAKQLTRSQAALLAAVLPNPHRMKVATPSAYVRQRQQWILKQMAQLGPFAKLEQHQ